MAQVIIFTNELGGVSVCIPTGELPIEAVQAKDTPKGSLIVNTSDLPNQHNDFFDAWELVDGKVEVSLTKAKEFSTYDNDILNIIWHTSSYKKKVFDGDYMFDNPAHNSYYGCSILPYEVIPGTVTIKDNKIHCNGKPVKLYHLATGRTPHKQPIKEIFPPHTHAVIDDILN